LSLGHEASPPIACSSSKNHLRCVRHWIEVVMTSLPLRNRGVVFNWSSQGYFSLYIEITKVRTSINTPWHVLFTDIKWIPIWVHSFIRCLWE
jgi:hypothetical protein